MREGDLRWSGDIQSDGSRIPIQIRAYYLSDDDGIVDVLTVGGDNNPGITDTYRAEVGKHLEIIFSPRNIHHSHRIIIHPGLKSAPPHP